MPLPQPDSNGDKATRGQVLAIGGGMQVPGAILLSGVAALRAGAGKLQLATASPLAAALGMAVPEALVVSLPVMRTGEIAGERAGRVLQRYVEKADAVLLGPGMLSERSALALLRSLVRHVGDEATLVLDAEALVALAGDEGLLHSLEGRVIITPHAGEMATLLGVDKTKVDADPRGAACAAADQFGAVVALKGPESWIASPHGLLFHYDGGNVGLATSGSGDTLAGIVAGLAARGAEPAQAAVWGAYLHGAAGGALARRVGPLGFLARELLDEVPALLQRLR
jgi:ADP-dependent NAD(P)H-hydrate dehydratase